MVAVSYHHGLEAGPEGPAHLVYVVLRHGGPLSLLGGLPGIKAWVGSSTGLALHKAPDPVVKGRGIWGGRGTEAGRPEVGQIFPTPIMHNLGFVAQHSVLLPVVVAVWVSSIQPGLDGVPHDRQVLLGLHSEAPGEPEGQHSFPVGADHTQHHGRC